MAARGEREAGPVLDQAREFDSTKELLRLERERERLPRERRERRWEELSRRRKGRVGGGRGLSLSLGL